MSTAPVFSLTPAQPAATVVNITPEVAQRWLELNTHNRNVRPSVVAQYARDMAAGKWQFTGEAIKFAPDGTILDGQHRLLASVKSGATFTSLIVNGLDSATQDVMDSGAKRQAADAFRLAGVKNPTIVAATARLAMNIEAGRLSKSRFGSVTSSYSNAEIFEFVQQSPGLVDAAVAAAHYRDLIDAHTSVMAYVWWRCGNVSAKATGEFFETVANSQTGGKGDARAALLRRLQTARRNNERLSQHAQVSLFMRAWNAWRRGQEVHRLQVETRLGEPIAIPVPR